MAAKKLMAGHINPTVVQIIAVSNNTGCDVLGSNTLHASLKEQGLPITHSNRNARQNSNNTTAQIGNKRPNIIIPPRLSLKAKILLLTFR